MVNILTRLQEPHWQRRLYWTILISILVAGYLPRVLIAGFSLPYLDYPDESSLYLLAQQWRGLYQFDTPVFEGYPPIYVGLNLVVQVIMERLGHPVQGEIVGVLRVISCVFSTLTALVLAETARRIAGMFAGLLAAALFAFSVDMIMFSRVAVSDPLAVLVVALALLLAVIAAQDARRRHFALLSILLGALGIFVKYPVAPVMAAGGVVILWMLFTEQRGKVLRYILGIVLIVAVAGGLLLLYSGTDYSSRYITRNDQTGFQNLLVPSHTLNNLYFAALPLRPLMPVAVFGIILSGVAAYFLARRSDLKTVGPLAVLPIVAVAVLQPWAVTVFSVVTEEGRWRDVLPATAGIVVLVSVALAQIVYALPTSRRTLGRSAVVGVLFGLVFWPQLVMLPPLVKEHRQPDTRVALRAWTETTLEPGWVLVTQINEKLFNNYWSGLPGYKWFDWLVINDMATKSLDHWREERGATYAVLTTHEVDAILAMSDGQAYLDQMLFLREFDEPAEHRGPGMSVFRLWRPQHETAVTFGDAVVLAGYDTEYAADDSVLTLRLYWRAGSTPAADYSLFVHVVSQDDRAPVAQWDGPPAMPTRATYSWDTPDETIIGDPITVPLPEDLPSGEYRVLIGLYDYLTGARLPVLLVSEEAVQGGLADDSLHLQNFTIAE